MIQRNDAQDAPARRPWSICAWPGCRALVQGARHCAVHSPQAEAATKAALAAARRAHDQTRDRSANRHYGSAWRRLRASILAAEPRCRLCGAPATEVDHILALARGGTNDRTNLRPLCKPCHSRKTIREDGGLGNRRPRA